MFKGLPKEQNSPNHKRKKSFKKVEIKIDSSSTINTIFIVRVGAIKSVISNMAQIL